MRPGAAERLGVGYEQVHEINPRAVYLYAPGWGSSGPNAHRQSFAPMLSGHCGTGYEVAGQFNPPMWPLGNEDPGNGLVGAIAALIALIERQRTGQGQYVENPQLNAAMVHLQHIARGADGTVLGAGQLDPLQTGVGPLDRLYQTSDGWIAVVAKSASEITALTAVTGIDILDDQRFATPLARKENEYELGSMLDEVLIAKSSSDWITALTAAGVGAVEPVSGDVVAQFHRDPENQRSGQIAEISLPDGRTLRLISRLIRVSHCAPVEQRPSPALGEHTDTVLRSLGYDDAKIAELRGREAIR
jgi:crotonobetainyl-CoA:carnitine CoA-transferase CaiB-like acyl-CoA transferase